MTCVRRGEILKRSRRHFLPIKCGTYDETLEYLGVYKTLGFEFYVFYLLLNDLFISLPSHRYSCHERKIRRKGDLGTNIKKIGTSFILVKCNVDPCV